MKILIADDHPMNLKLLRAQLEAEAMTVIEAGDGLQVLAVLEREPVDAIISDVLMPNMDGYQLCYTLHKSERFQAIPFILYSNTFASDSSKELALGFGADQFLKKPAPAQDILAALHEVMRQGARSPRVAAAAHTVQHLKETQLYSEHLIR